MNKLAILKWLCILVSLIAGSSSVQAQSFDQRAAHGKNSLSVDILYCLDAEAKLSIEQAVDCKYVPKVDLPRGKLSDATYWIRIQANPHSDQNSAAIRIGPHFVGRIELFENMKGNWRIQTAGRNDSFNDAHATLGGYVFQTDFSQVADNTIYIRVKTPGLGLILIDVAASNPQGFDSISNRLGIGVHIGALMLILAFSIISYAVQPGALLFRFLWLTVDLLLCILGGSGILAEYVFTQHLWLDRIFFNWMVCLRLACWVWVSQAFLQPYETSDWYKISCKMIYFLVFVGMMLVIAEKIAWLQHLLLLGFIATSLSQIIAIQITPGIHQSYRRTFLIGFLATNGLIFMTIIIAAYPFSSAYTAVFITRVLDFVTPLVLLAFIGFRNRRMRQEYEEVKSTNMLINIRLEFERKLLKERRVLLDMLTHELKNPLASISMAIGSLKKMLTIEQSSAQRRLHNMTQSILNMDSIIERCHLMNQIDNKELSPRYTNINLRDCMIEVVSQQHEQSRIQLKVDFEMMISTDVDLLRIILANLLQNALKYSPLHSVIHFEVSDTSLAMGSDVCIFVTNETKHGRIPDQDKIFERFYRDPHDLDTGGSGLGLYLVRELCIILGGSVRLLPDMNRVTFQITLPNVARGDN